MIISSTGPAPLPESGRTFGFGAPKRPRRSPLPASTKSNAELVAEYLARKDVTKCPTLYADGSVRVSGAYEF